MIEFDGTAPLYEDVDPAVEARNLEKLESCTSSLATEALSSSASAFTSNIRAIFHLLGMPHIVSAYSQGYAATQALQFAETFLADKSLFGEDLRAEFDSKSEQGDVGPVNVIPDLLTDDDLGVRVALESQLSLVTVAVWTALETLGHDVWVEAVNSFPEPLARYALTKQGEETRGSEPKSIRANWLTKYGFDLRTRMGTVLADDEARFRFGSPDQIIKSYKAIIKEPKEVEGMWAEISKDLNLLNLTRNLIAHRAGMVDERFNKQAKLGLPLGKRLPLTNDNVHQFVTLTVIAGCKLLTLCDAQLSDLSIEGK